MSTFAVSPFLSAHRATALQEAELEVLEASRCEDIYRREQFLPQLKLRYPELLQRKSIFCASYPDRSACQVGMQGWGSWTGLKRCITVCVMCGEKMNWHNRSGTAHSSCPLYISPIHTSNSIHLYQFSVIIECRMRFASSLQRDGVCRLQTFWSPSSGWLRRAALHGHKWSPLPGGGSRQRRVLQEQRHFHPAGAVHRCGRSHQVHRQCCVQSSTFLRADTRHGPFLSLWCFLQGHGVPFYLFFLPVCCRRERRMGRELCSVLYLILKFLVYL